MDKFSPRPLLATSVFVCAFVIPAQGDPLVLSGHGHPVRALSFGAGGKTLFSGSEDAKVFAWNLKQRPSKKRRRKQKLWREVCGGNGYVGALATKPDGKLLAVGSHDGVVRIFDTRRFKLRRKLEGHEQMLSAVAWHPSSEVLVSGTAKVIRVWNAKTGKLLRKIDAHEHWVTALAFSPDGARLASGGYDKSVHVWDPASGKRLVTAAESRMGMIFGLAWYPDGKHLIIAGQGTSFVKWNPESNQSSTLFRGHSDLIKAVAFSPDGKRLASVSKDRSLRIWDPEAATVQHSFKGMAAEPLALAWAPDGKSIAAGGRDKEIRIFQVPAAKK